MFVSFEPFSLLFWVFVTAFIPGALVSFSVFRKSGFSFTEKLLAGFGLGLFLLPMIPFLLYLLLGIKYSYGIALASAAVFYLVSVLLFIVCRTYEDIGSLKMPGEGISVSRGMTVSAAIILLVIVAFWVRLGTYSPVFQELDPYYYTYAPYQILLLGENPVDDQTAWYPEVVANHRIIPSLSYLEALWYSFYTGGAAVDNMLLADIASVYPPIMAALSVFFLYLFISSAFKREWAVIGAGIASFAPMLLYKTFAGEQEVQAYAFFALGLFLAMYAFMLKKKELKFAVMAGLGFMALSLGSSSQIVALAVMILFIPLQAMILFIREDDPEELKTLTVNNTVIFILGPLLATGLKSVFSAGSFYPGIAIPILMVLAFSGLLYVLKRLLSDGAMADRVRKYVVISAAVLAIVPLLLLAADLAAHIPISILRAFSVVLALIPVAFYFIKGSAHAAVMNRAFILAVIIAVGAVYLLTTPAGDYFKSVGAVFGIASYNSPLDRTIAEQGITDTLLASQMGFVAESYDNIASTVLGPLSSSMPDLRNAVSALFSLLSAIPSLLVNLLMQAFVFLANSFLGTTVEYSAKSNSFLMLWLFLFFAGVVYALYKFVKGMDRDSLVILFVVVIIPPLIVGIIKAKYTIYAAYMLAVAISFVLAEGEDGIKRLLPRYVKSEKEIEDLKSSAYYCLLAFGAFILILQLVQNGYVPVLFASNFQPRFQDNPLALQEKFERFCSSTGDADICAASQDPMGYASNGTNYQYSSKLCAYSLISDPAAITSVEYQAISVRCMRITDYWLDSMEWIRYNTEEGSRTTSWWDYGHWINYFGLKNAVLRNEHLSHIMIGEVAHAYVDGTPEELAQFMREHDSDYALFDTELVVGGGALGGKFGALNYLSCARDNLTNVSYDPGASDCESEHLWESVLVPADSAGRECTISGITGQSGITAYKVVMRRQGADSLGLQYYPPYCLKPVSDQNAMMACQYYIALEPAYCIGETTLADGQKSYATYYLDQTYPNGDLKLNKAFLSFPQQTGDTYHAGEATMFTLLYTNDAVWMENGEVKSGYEDRKGKFYDSNIYRAIFLNDLPGFEQAYSTSDGAVKIYRLIG